VSRRHVLDAASTAAAGGVLLANCGVRVKHTKYPLRTGEIRRVTHLLRSATRALAGLRRGDRLSARAEEMPALGLASGTEGAATPGRARAAAHGH
jgi:hypothetical protein